MDAKANRPAFAVGYHVPPRLTKEHAAMVLLDRILLQGQDSLLYDELVRKRGMTENLSGGINYPLGDAHNYFGPMLWSVDFIHDASTTTDKILEAFDSVISRVQSKPLAQEDLDRALVKFRASRYRSYGQFGGFGKADALASFALFDDKPELINKIEDDLAGVTPELIQKVAQTWLKPSNRTILTLEAGAPASEKGE